VIGEALRQAVTGRGHRGIAAELGFAADTVRGWIRRACAQPRDSVTIPAPPRPPEHHIQ
jgi:hypothetical protein